MIFIQDVVILLKGKSTLNILKPKENILTCTNLIDIFDINLRDNPFQKDCNYRYFFENLLNF